VKGKDYLDLRAIVILIIMTLLWGLSYPAIKYSNQGVSPVFASTLRSFIASICGVIYCIRKRERLFVKIRTWPYRQCKVKQGLLPQVLTNCAKRGRFLSEIDNWLTLYTVKASQLVSLNKSGL